jgi:hypothetical protein
MTFSVGNFVARLVHEFRLKIFCIINQTQPNTTTLRRLRGLHYYVQFCVGVIYINEVNKHDTVHILCLNVNRNWQQIIHITYSYILIGRHALDL